MPDVSVNLFGDSPGSTQINSSTDVAAYVSSRGNDFSATITKSSSEPTLTRSSSINGGVTQTNLNLESAYTNVVWCLKAKPTSTASNLVINTIVQDTTPKHDYGETKTDYKTTDHNGWVQLDGRAISTLTTSQQAQATSLGFGTNLPNLVDNGDQIITRHTSVSITGATIDYTKIRGKNYIRYIIDERTSNSGNEIFIFPEAFIDKPVATVNTQNDDGVVRVTQAETTTTQVSWNTDTGGSIIPSQLIVEGRASATTDIGNKFIYLGN